MADEEVSETSFTLLEPPEKIDATRLPQSPKKAFVTAEAIGWSVRAWLSLGVIAPAVYVTTTENHNAGDKKADGYIASMFTIEARDELMPLGFRALYIGKQYEDSRKAPAGSFSTAAVVDPVGVPRLLSFEYQPIKQLRGKAETEKSWKGRLDAFDQMAADQRSDYNDGDAVFNTSHVFTAAGEFDSWLADWKSFTEKVTKK